MLQREAASNHYLKDAIDSMLAGQPIEVASTESVGCLINFPEQTARARHADTVRVRDLPDRARVGVGANRAPWRCLVSNDGVVQEVMFTGDDSAGVDQSAAPAEKAGFIRVVRLWARSR